MPISDKWGKALDITSLCESSGIDNHAPEFKDE
jgi:hypothetical protein